MPEDLSFIKGKAVNIVYNTTMITIDRRRI